VASKPIEKKESPVKITPEEKKKPAKGGNLFNDDEDGEDDFFVKKKETKVSPAPAKKTAPKKNLLLD
jgi:hypothetical protein